MQNLTERDYTEVRSLMFAMGLEPKLVLDPENMEVVGSASQLQKFQELAEPIIKARLASKHKMEGFDYEGKVYSATAEDQHGLADIMVAFNAGIAEEANFHLENGEVITLNPENIIAFGTAFFVFRNQFFEVST